MRRYRRFWGSRCPPSIITGIFLAPGCSRKSEPNKFILLAEGLEFFPRILVYLHVDVHPYMESRPKQSASPDRSIRSDASAPRQESKRRKHSRSWTRIRTGNKTPEARRISELSGALFR